MHVPEMNSIQAQPAYYRMHKTKDMFHLQAHPILIIIKKYTIVTVIAHALIIRYKRTPALISGISACAFKRISTATFNFDADVSRRSAFVSSFVSVSVTFSTFLRLITYFQSGILK